MPAFLDVSSASNPAIKELRALLRGRKSSRGDARFAGEGIQLLTRALTSDVTVDYVVLSEDFADLLPIDLAELLDDSRARCFRISESLFEKMSRRNMRSGAAFVATARAHSLTDLLKDAPILVLDRVSNPRNVGAIARTCEAAGLGGLILTGSHVDPFSYESLRASMGSVFGVPIVSCSEKEMLGWVSSNLRTLIGTSGGAEDDLWNAALPASSALMFGNEGEGLSDHLIATCDALVKIPYNAAVDSLNLGAAVAVVAFEYRRRNPQ
ncbi:MAG: RNA methyltransferase [Scrofimicrobium sp.]